MRRAFSVVLCVCLFLCVLWVLHLQTLKKQTAWVASTVKIIVGEGHGSGAHIGSRYILTAAHVVTGQTEVKIKTASGDEALANVLWLNKEHDVALLRAKELPASVSVSRLNCEATSIGQSIEAIGNPGPLEFIHSYGHIASDVQERANWKSTVIASLAIAPGSSGGPVLDMRGRVVGIVVGVALANIGGFAPSAVALAYLVPASSICTLMARRA